MRNIIIAIYTLSKIVGKQSTVFVAYTNIHTTKFVENAQPMNIIQLSHELEKSQLHPIYALVKIH